MADDALGTAGSWYSPSTWPTSGWLGVAPGEFPGLLTVAVVVMYACVPETDHLTNIGLMTAGLAVVEILTQRRSHVVAAGLAFVLVLWAGRHGAAERGSAIVGALFALWPLVLVASAARWTQVVWWQRWAIGAVGAVAALFVARTGALEPTVWPAVASVAVAAPISFAIAVVIARVGDGALRSSP